MGKNDKKNQHRWAQGNTNEEPKQEKEPDHLIFSGVVEEAMRGAMFKVQLAENQTILCTLAGKLKVNRIRILVGDRVDIKVSPYDLTRGLITYRR